MAHAKEILVVTTSAVDGLKIKQYLKPVSAHVVTGTNLFTDFLGGISDIFGGRSEAYQKQLTSLYNEAIERIKYAAYEVGANCIIGLNIDMDEISGKGKSMFMITAVGTAVILDKKISENTILPKHDERLENVGVEKVNTLRKKLEIIEKAKTNCLSFDDNTWAFIVTNQVDEVFSYVLKMYENAILNEQYYPGSAEKFHHQLVGYINALPENKKIDLLYTGVSEQNEQIAFRLSTIIKELNLFDFDKIMELLNNENFNVRKLGIRITTFDKPFYNSHDLLALKNIQQYIQDNFSERGRRTTKKQLLSSKEKEVWICECGKTNDIDTFCIGCEQDIYGFKQTELKPNEAADFIKLKTELILEYLR